MRGAAVRARMVPAAGVEPSDCGAVAGFSGVGAATDGEPTAYTWRPLPVLATASSAPSAVPAGAGSVISCHSVPPLADSSSTGATGHRPAVGDR